MDQGLDIGRDHGVGAGWNMGPRTPGLMPLLFEVLDCEDSRLGIISSAFGLHMTAELLWRKPLCVVHTVSL